MTNLLAIPRLSAEHTMEVTPWEFTPPAPIPENVIGASNKNNRTRWASNPQTEHCFFSGFEGLNARLRVSKENQVYKMRALVVDYDRPNVDLDHAIETIVNYEGLTQLPNFASSTLSGGVRLVWVLSEPLNVHGNPTASKLLAKMKNELNLSKLLAGLDADALGNPAIYYEVGGDWRQISETPLPSELVIHWLSSALHVMDVPSKDDIEVNYDIVQETLEKKYPHVKFPALAPGVRMRRFWDSGADNESSVCFMNTGVFCFTGDQGFIPWSDRCLLGKKIVEEEKSKIILPVLAEYWFDGTNYITKNIVDGKWITQTASNATLQIASRFGLSRTPAKRGQLSPVEEVLVEIQNHKRVSALTNFVQMPEGPIEFQGERYINKSTVKVMPPSGNSGEWGEHFPYIARFLDGLFVEEHQKLTFLAWWKRFYTGGLLLKPTQGQVMIIAGPVECGKSLLNTKLIATSVGGGVDASDYYANGSSFNGLFYDVALHMVDDSEPGKSIRARKEVAARYKKAAATSVITVNKKYEKTSTVQWSGRVCVTMNADVDSMKTMPELQESLQDKLIVLQAKSNPGIFSGVEDPGLEMTRELPDLLQWLLDWDPPKEVKHNSRYGVKSYCDTQLRRKMEADSADMLFLEVLRLYFEELHASDPEIKVLHVSTTELHSRICDCEVTKHAAREYSPVRIGRILARLQDRGFPFQRKRSNKCTIWYLNTEFEINSILGDTGDDK